MRYVTLFLICVSVVWAQTYEPLQPQLRAIAERLIPYTAADRVRVAEEAKKMFNFYVNRDAKISLYGPEIDPLPKIEKLIQDAPGMSDRDFHDAMSRLFKSQRDGHLFYKYPGNQSCFTAYTGFKFDIVNTGEIVISEVRSGMQSSNDLGQVQIGDSFIAFDGESIPQLVESLTLELSAGNDDARLRKLLSYLELRPGARYRIPSKDTFELKLKCRQTGELYWLTLPWLVNSPKGCVKNSDTVTKVSTVKRHMQRLNGIPEMVSSDLDRGTSFEKRSAPNSDTGIPWVRTESSVIFWHKFRLEDFQVGLLQITTFNGALFNQTTLELISRVLSNQLNDTNALILDLRNNSGGSADMTALLVKLFMKDPVSSTGRFKITAETKSLYDHALLDNQEFYSAFRQTPPGQTWSNSFPFPDYQYLPKISAVYSKPIGILTNGNCFSGCELFTALMKDNGLATVFGEDSTTNGGGASTMGHRQNLSPDKSMFNLLPLQASLDMWVTFCQLTRQNGKLIEDFGVESDYLVRPSIKDILPGGQNVEQLSTIASVLRENQ